MRIALVLLYAAFAAAAPNPRPQEDEDASSSEPMETVPSVTSLNTTTFLSIPLPTLPSGNMTLPISPNTTFTDPISITPTATLPSTRSTRSHKPHTEPIPIFTSQCGCPDPMKGPKPCWATDALQSCHVEEISSRTCWFINAGCPSPTRECSKLFKPTPLGKNPCEMTPPDTRPANAHPTITAVPMMA